MEIQHHSYISISDSLSLYVSWGKLPEVYCINLAVQHFDMKTCKSRSMSFKTCYILQYDVHKWLFQETFECNNQNATRLHQTLVDVMNLFIGFIKILFTQE